MPRGPRFVILACLALAGAMVGCAPYRTVPKSDPNFRTSQGAALCDSLDLGALVDIGLKSGGSVTGKMIRVTAESVTVEQSGSRQYREVVVARPAILAMSVARGPSDAAVTTLTALGLLAAFVVAIGASLNGSFN